MINITRHALMRYISRRELSKVITDSTFDNWKREFPDKADSYNSMLIDEFEKADFITERAFDTYKKAKYYVNTTTLMVFIVNDNNLVTCYCSDYGLGEELDRVILSSLLVGMSKKSQELDLYRSTASVRRSDAYDKIQGIKSEVSELETRIMALRKSIKTQEAIIEEMDAQEKSLSTQLFGIISKIVKPKNSI